MSEVSKVLGALATIAEAAKPFLPPGVQAPVTVASVLVRSIGDATGAHIPVESLAAQGTAAGQAAYNASKLAGLQAAVEQEIAGWINQLEDGTDVRQLTRAVMAEVLKRWPQ